MARGYLPTVLWRLPLARHPLPAQLPLVFYKIVGQLEEELGRKGRPLNLFTRRVDSPFRLYMRLTIGYPAGRVAESTTR